MRYTIVTNKMFILLFFVRSFHGRTKLGVRALLPIQMCSTKFLLMCTLRPNPKPFFNVEGCLQSIKYDKDRTKVQNILLRPRGLPEMISISTRNAQVTLLKDMKATWRNTPNSEYHNAKFLAGRGFQNEDNRGKSTVNKNTSSSQIVVAYHEKHWQEQHKQQRNSNSSSGNTTNVVGVVVVLVLKHRTRVNTGSSGNNGI